MDGAGEEELVVCVFHDHFYELHQLDYGQVGVQQLNPWWQVWYCGSNCVLLLVPGRRNYGHRGILSA